MGRSLPIVTVRYRPKAAVRLREYVGHKRTYRTMMWSCSRHLRIYFVKRNASSTRAKAGEGCLRLG